jgi:signal transduction histidine kinase/ActR/RegA family two-component response regulator
VRTVAPVLAPDHDLHVEAGTGVSRAAAENGAEAGARAAREALASVRRHAPSVVFAFASVRYDLEAVLAGVRSVFRDAPIVGASTAGEIRGGEHRESVAVGVLASPFLRVRVGVGREVSRGWRRALDAALDAPQLAPWFDGTPTAWAELAAHGRSAFAFVVSPGNTRHAASSSFDVLEAMKRRTLGRLSIFGGSAADDWRMERNFVLVDDRAEPDALLVALFETELQWGMGLEHGLVASGASATVTSTDGHEVVTLDGRPAIEVYAELLGTTRETLSGQHLTLATRRVLGSADSVGTYIPNVASYATPRGGVLLTRTAPPGTVLTPLAPTPQTTSTAGPDAIRKARLRGGITRPAFALASYCALRPKLLGDASRVELGRMQDALGAAPLFGFASFGEQAPADDGGAQHTNAVIAALVIGSELSPAARVAREYQTLRAETNALRVRSEREMERIVANRTAELRAAEAAARRHERAARTLGAAIEAQVRASEERQLVEDVCRIVVEVGGYRLCWVGMAEGDAERSVRPVARWGVDDGYVDGVGATWADVERGRGPVGTAIRTGRVALARRISDDPAFEVWRREAERRGFEAMVALPLVTDAGVLGALAIYAGDVDALQDEEEVRLLEKLAEDLSFGIGALRGRAERRSMLTKLVEADRLAAVGTLAAGVAHEINNPLAYLLGGLEYVEQQLGGAAGPCASLDEIRVVLGEMRTGGERIREIVKDLKTFSRDGEGTRVAIDVRHVADASINMAASELKQHSACVQREYGPVRAVLASEARLGQVVVNLLVNAAHAFEEAQGSRPREIAVRTRMDGLDRVVLEIADTGRGIPPENLTRIFEPFFTTKPVGVGTGLGLWISRNLVLSLGGDLEVESATGVGSVFRVVLPAARAEPVRPEPQVNVPPGPRARVLLVDDDEFVARAVQRALEPEHDVVVETDGRRALDRIAAGEPFGAILCDLMMPGMTGMELHAKLVERHPPYAERLVFITGGAFTPEARAYVERAGNRCLEKPFVNEALRATVRAVVGAARGA